jgi:ABC-2 family transporter
MQSLIAAEWRKLLGHSKAVSFLISIYPIGAFVIVVLIGIVPPLLFESVREFTAARPRAWTDDLLSVWNAMNGFPGGTFLRMPFLAFTAIAFAGEYQWGTWKNIVPRQSRTALILTKFLILGVLIMLSLMLTSLIVTGSGWLTAVLFDVPYGPSLAELDVAAFFQEYIVQVLVTFVGTLIVAAYAALIAMYSRSILASLLLSVGITIFEFASILLLLIVGNAFNLPNLVNLFVLTPTYNLENVRSWVIDGIGSTAGGIPSFTAVPSLWISILILLLWLIGLLGLTAVIFNHQDITT